jgi:DNA-binding transcriptional MerR regulator
MMEYQIGDFATISRLSIKTLRYYHEIGLLQPSRVDRFSGYRYFNEASLARVRSIQQLKALNFSLTEIHEILSNGVAPEAIRKKMHDKLCEVDQQIESFQEVRDRLQIYLEKAALPLLIPNPIYEVYLQQQLIASMRFIGEYQQLNEKIPVLLQSCSRFVCGPPFSLYYDPEPLAEGADIEICVPVCQPVEDTRVHSRLLPGGRALTILHAGAYDQISISYQAVVDFMHSQALRALYPSREVYLNGGNPQSPQESEDYRTEIQFLVA